MIDTHQRQEAIQPQYSYLVQAPAGSGKTELLIQRILALLAIVDEPEEILALTFTRKAASEMRERVLAALKKAQEPEPQEEHAKTTWLLAKEVLAQSERKGWRLASYPAQLRIMTMDSFASGLARQLPVLSGFGQTPSTSDFSEPLYQSAVEDLIQYAQQSNAPEPLKKAMDTMILHLDCNIGKLSKLLCAMLARREQWLPDVLKHSPNMFVFKEHLESCLESVIEHTLFEAYETMPENIRGSLPALVVFAEEQLSNASEGKLHMLSPLQGITRFPEPEMYNTAQWQAVVDLLVTAGTGNKVSFRKKVDTRQGFPTGDTFKPFKEEMIAHLTAIQENKKLLKLLVQVRMLPHSSSFEDSDWQVLDALFASLKILAGQLWQTFEQHKKVDFIEVMLRAKQALGSEDTQGNVIPSDALLRLDHQIKHILVDEFQDTSGLQIDILSRLTAGWENDGRTLFMVGDPMQSIYRFRKAEVSLFLKASKNELQLPSITSLKLSQNFRSSPFIVDWVNRAFENILPIKDDVLAGAITYTPSQAFKLDQGKVTLNVLRQRDDSLEAENIIDLISQATMQGKKVGVLARSRSHLHTLMLMLQEQNIPFRAMDMLPLHQQPEIIDLRSLACALLHPADFVAWASLLRSKAVGLTLSSLLQIFGKQPESPWFAIQEYANQNQNHRLNVFIAAISPAIAQKGRVPLRKLVESTWLKLSIASTLSETQLANTDAFFELLEAVEAEDHHTGFIDVATLDQRLEKLFAKPESKLGSELVELMTMHGAKGLQWDTVILPGLGKQARAKDKDVLVQTETNTHQGQQLLLAPLPEKGSSKSDGGSIYDLIRDFEKQRDALEVARLLYVACTRAEHELHLFGHVSESDETPSSSSLLALLWQDSESCYDAEVMWLENPKTDDQRQSWQTPKGRTPLRIDPKYIPPTPHPSIPATSNNVQNTMTPKPEFSWASATARAVGIALHAGLQHLADVGFEHWTEELTNQETKKMLHILIEEGISQVHINKALRRCQLGFEKTLHSERAQWILSKEHAEQHNEWAITYVDGEHCKHIILDRSFVDQDGIRWIIDYKTGNHENDGIDSFLDQELKRYTHDTPQLPNYVKALQSLEPEREIKAALYFPMVDGWRVWQSS